MAMRLVFTGIVLNRYDSTFKKQNLDD